MNRERCKELLPILEAFANGEDIQFHDGDDWFDIGKEGLDAESLDDDGLEYRIKPKPREFWIAGISPDQKTHRQKYVDCSDAPTAFINAIKVREVLE